MGHTPMWRVREKPEYEVERTPGLWVLWGPCTGPEPHELLDEDGEPIECELCGGTGQMVIETCGMDEEGNPLDPEMIYRNIGLTSWTPERLQ